MTDNDFAKCFFIEKEQLLKTYFNNEVKTAVSSKIKELNLDDKQKEVLKQIIDGVLTDTMYTVLLGLDGCAQIGGVQQLYKIYDEENNELSGNNIEGCAYNYFHGNQKII